jgi:hypothetical protein
MKATLVVAAILVGCTIVPFLTTSRLYWGYWIVPPSPNASVSSIASVERFTTFWCCTPNSSGRQALQEAAQDEFSGAGDSLASNLPAALVQLDLQPRSEEAVPAAILTKIEEALESRGVLRGGQPGYARAKELWGHVAIGRDAHGSELIVAALWGGEVSNDHYPFYEGVFESLPTGALHVRDVRQYWFDFAGLEGLAHWLAAFAGLMVGAALSVMFLIRRNLRAA